MAMGCCLKQTDNCNQGVADKPVSEAEEVIYTQGCYQAIKDDLQSVVVALGVTTLILGLVQVSFNFLHAQF